MCYARDDMARADELQRVLEAAGIAVWRDVAVLLPGQDWQLAVRRAISEDALAFVACFSRAGLAEGGGYRYEELLLAVEQFRRRQPGQVWLIPVRFDDCQVPHYDLGAGRTLASLHWADLFGETRAGDTTRLVQVIGQVLGRAPADAGGPGLPGPGRAVGVARPVLLPQAAFQPLDAPTSTGSTPGNVSADSSESVPALPRESSVREPAVRVRVRAVQVDGGTVSGIVAPQPPASADVQVTVGDAKNATITGVDLGNPRTGSADSSERVPALPRESLVREPAVRVRVRAVQVDGGTVSGIVAPQPPASADVQVTVGDAKNATITGVDLGNPRTGPDAR